MPPITKPRSKTMPVAVAGRTFWVKWVQYDPRQRKDRVDVPLKQRTGQQRQKPYTAGKGHADCRTNREVRANAKNSGSDPQRSSAIAIIPCAPTGAMGNGRRSMSLVRRKSPYPSTILSSFPNTRLKSQRPRAGIHASCQKVRWE